MWTQAQEWEREWHGTCANKVAGEYHQVSFIAPRMGLERVPGTSEYIFDLEGAKVLDIGGGAASLLLKCINVQGKVVDPLQFPAWVYARYGCAGIEWEVKKGEEIDETGYDEVWIYNCLQHSENPKGVIDAARRAGTLIRMYEYINIPICAGHIHTLREADLNQWLGGEGKVEGKRYFGIFPSNVNTQSYWDDIHRREGRNTWRVKDTLNDYVLGEIEGSVLELGCGAGVLARRIEGKYFGLDISPVAVGLMHEQGFDAEVRDIPPIDAGWYDTVVGLEFLEHLDADDRLAVIREASKKYDRAIFSVPDNCMPPEETVEHRIVFNWESFKGFLEQAFRKVRVVPVSDKGTGYLVGICEHE